jgi:cell division protein FtsW
LAFLFSASYLKAEVSSSSPYFYVLKQLESLKFGLVALLLTYFIPTKFWFKASLFGLIIAVLLLYMALTETFGIKAMGAYRWVKILDYRFQPSEFSKLALILFLARFLARHGELTKGLSYGFLPSLIFMAFFGFLIILEKDLGGAIVLAILILGMNLVSELKIRYFVIFTVLLGISFWVLVMSQEYRISRIDGWLDPFRDPQGAGYPILHSFYAFARGGIFGVGPGASVEKQFYIPEVHTDYIFSVVGEELGLVGVIFVAGLFLFFTARGFMIAKAATKLSDYYLAIGATLIISIPAFINMGVTLSIWPAKGLPLPFFSYGGSNLFFNLAAVGFLLNIAANSTYEAGKLKEDGHGKHP